MQKKLKSIIPSIDIIFFLFLFLGLVLEYPPLLLTDCDTGLHIKIGNFILNTFSIPNYDIFFATNPPLPYIAYEWLSQVIMALVHRIGGLTGIVIFFSFLISFSYYLLFKILRKETGNAVIAVVCIWIVVTFISSTHWLAKPHIFSILIFIVFYYILDLYQFKSRNYLYILPFIMVLWVNLHGAFTLGFLLCGIYFLGNILQFFLAEETQQSFYKEKAKKFFLITLLLIIASLLNPNSFKGLLQPFIVMSDNFLLNQIEVYASPNFHIPTYFYLELLFMLTIIAFTFSKRKQSIVEIILVLLFAHMAIYSVRNIPFFAIIIAPIILRYRELNFSRKDDISISDSNIRSGDKSVITLSVKDCFWLLLSVIIVLGLFISGHFRHQFDEKTKPVAAVDFLNKENIKGNMFNEFRFGSYIIYSAYPKYRVFIDGRVEMYGAERFNEYYMIKSIAPGWENILEKYNVNLIIIDTNSILSQFLLATNNWRIIYSDSIASIFVKNISENKLIVEKYKNVRPAYLK